jgi:hypothetical protein
MHRPGIAKTSGSTPHSRAAEGPRSRATITPETHAGSGQEGGRVEPRGPRDALGTSSTCAGHGEPPASLRAGGTPRTLSPARTAARRRSSSALRALPITDQAIAHYLGLASDRAGAEIRAGSKPLDVGEATDLLPAELALELVITLLLPRLDELPRLQRAAVLTLAATFAA